MDNFSRYLKNFKSDVKKNDVLKLSLKNYSTAYPKSIMYRKKYFGGIEIK
jgi:hypothetical protein